MRRGSQLFAVRSHAHFRKGRSVPSSHVDHAVLARHAENRVNIPAADVTERRRQVNYLRSRLEAHIAVHPDYDLVKLRAAGSTAKHTAIRRRRSEGSDADVAAYVRASSVGGTDADESNLLNWLQDRQWVSLLQLPHLYHWLPQPDISAAGRSL